MKSISLDFKNETICIMTEVQQGTEYKEDLSKVLFLDFIPKKYQDYNSFTWNFEDETLAVNQDYIPQRGTAQSFSDFIPKLIIPMPGLSARFDEFLKVMEFEEVDAESFVNDILREFSLSGFFNMDENEKDTE